MKSRSHDGLAAKGVLTSKMTTVTVQLTEDIACLNSLSLLKELFKKWSNLSFKSRRLWDKRKPKTVNYINEPLTSTLINDGHDGNETIKFYTKDISQMLSSPLIFFHVHTVTTITVSFSVCVRATRADCKIGTSSRTTELTKEHFRQHEITVKKSLFCKMGT